MRKQIMLFIPAVVLATAYVGGAAQAAVIGPMVGQLRGAADLLAVVETAQFMWGGRRYCWYDDGWHGPGWYWCGCDQFNPLVNPGTPTCSLGQADKPQE